MILGEVIWLFAEPGSGQGQVSLPLWCTRPGNRWWGRLFARQNMKPVA